MGHPVDGGCWFTLALSHSLTIKHKPELDKALTHHGLYAVKKINATLRDGGRQRLDLYILCKACYENKRPAHGMEE